MHLDLNIAYIWYNIYTLYLKLQELRKRVHSLSDMKNPTCMVFGYGYGPQHLGSTQAHGSGVRCPVLFWSSPSTFQEEAGCVSTSETKSSFPNKNVRCMKWQQKMPLHAPRLVGWQHSYLWCDTFLGSKVLCFLLGEEADSCIRQSFNGCPFHLFSAIWQIEANNPFKIVWDFSLHDVESENVWLVFEPLFSEANIKEAQRCARCMLLVLSCISRFQKYQVVGDRRFQLGAG